MDRVDSKSKLDRVNSKLDNMPVRLFNSRALNDDNRLRRLGKEDPPVYGDKPLYMQAVPSEEEGEVIDPARRIMPNSRQAANSLNEGQLRELMASPRLRLLGGGPGRVQDEF